VKSFMQAGETALLAALKNTRILTATAFVEVFGAKAIANVGARAVCPLSCRKFVGYWQEFPQVFSIITHGAQDTPLVRQVLRHFCEHADATADVAVYESPESEAEVCAH
jgi:hypothetical protein